MSGDRGRPLLGLALVGLILLTGACGGEERPAEVDLPTSTASSSEPGSTPEGDRPDRPATTPEPSPPPRNGQKVQDTDSAAYSLRLPEQEPARSVAESLLAYLDARLQAYNSVEVDLAALARTATGDPINQVQRYVAELSERGNRTVGDVWLDAPADAVRVRGKQATVREACLRNASVDVDAGGVAVESAPSAYRLSATLTKVAADAWLVTEFSVEPSTDC